jgi:phosphatidate cytidylyltransferase
MIAVLLASLLFSPWPFVALVCVALAAALHELIQALARIGFHVPYIPLVVGSVFTEVAAARSGVQGVVVGVFLTLAAGTLWRALEGDYRPLPVPTGPASSAGPAGPARLDDADGAAPGGSASMAGAGSRAVKRGRHAAGGPAVPARGVIQDIYATAFVTAYLPTLAALVVLLSFKQEGRWLVLLLVGISVASDTGGYFAGSYFGKHKLAAIISPKKTWEGLAGSVGLALLAGLGGMVLMGRPWYFGVALGLFGALAATLGDLAESLLKRAIDIKDMGTLLPGHGGVLDRVDSVLMTAPFFYVVITLFGTEVFG